GGSLTITAAGFGINSGTVYGSPSTTDGFYYIYQVIQGDLDVELQVNSPPSSTGASGPGMVGIMMRNDVSDSSAHMFIGVSQNNDFRQVYRSAVGNSGVLTTSGAYVKPSW